MPNQNVFKLGYSSILVESDDFEEGYYNGYTTYPEEAQPLTVEAIRKMLATALSNTSETTDADTGYIIGVARSIYEGHPSLWDTEPETLSVQFGSVTLRLNRWRFGNGYDEGQQAYEADHAERPSTRTVTAMELLRYAAYHDPKTNQYRITENELTHLEAFLGRFVGYLCAALFPTPTQGHKTESVPVTTLQEV